MSERCDRFFAGAMMYGYREVEMGDRGLSLSRFPSPHVVIAVALLAVCALAQEKPHTGLVAGGTVLINGKSKPFVEPKSFSSFPYTRNFDELLEVAKTSDIDALPKISAYDIKRLDFKPYSAAEFASIRKGDTVHLIDCPGFCRFRKATVELLDGTTKNVFIYCVETLYGPEDEMYFLGHLNIQAVVAR
jgi:hypothetical protein